MHKPISHRAPALAEDSLAWCHLAAEAYYQSHLMAQRPVFWGNAAIGEANEAALRDPCHWQGKRWSPVPTKINLREWLEAAAVSPRGRHSISFMAILFSRSCHVIGSVRSACSISVVQACFHCHDCSCDSVASIFPYVVYLFSKALSLSSILIPFGKSLWWRTLVTIKTYWLRPPIPVSLGQLST